LKIWGLLHAGLLCIMTEKTMESAHRPSAAVSTLRPERTNCSPAPHHLKEAYSPRATPRTPSSHPASSNLVLSTPKSLQEARQSGREREKIRDASFWGSASSARVGGTRAAWTELWKKDGSSLLVLARFDQTRAKSRLDAVGVLGGLSGCRGHDGV
jgi:hypothetical protein